MLCARQQETMVSGVLCYSCNHDWKLEEARPSHPTRDVSNFNPSSLVLARAMKVLNFRC